MKTPVNLDRRFREAAAAAGLLDVAYDLADSPVGELLVAVTDRGLCRISFSPEIALDGLALAFGRRVLRVPRALVPVRRELDEYFTGRRQAFELTLDLSPLPAFQRLVLQELAQVAYGRMATYGELAGSPEGIPTNILAERLKRLEEAGIVERTAYQERPTRYAYTLSAKGRDLEELLAALRRWGKKHIPGARTYAEAAGTTRRGRAA